MIDYRHIADDLRGFIEGAERTPDASVAALAQAYAAACNGANARLRRCDDLLRRGLRTEAIHLSQEPPDLLDVVNALDVPGIQVWENFCAQNDLTRPPRLLVDVATELNDAYAVEAPMQASLDELRLLALARAPVTDRLRVTRRLRALDPNTPHWAQDVAELERIYLNTIRGDVAQVLRAEDGTAARHLIADLTSPDWINHPPGDLLEPLVALASRTLVADLQQAQSSNDLRGTRRALHAIDKILDATGARLSASQRETYDSATAWLSGVAQQDQNQQAFDDACATLCAQIAANAPPAHLRALHSRLRAFGLPLPTTLQSAYDQAVRSNGGGWGILLIALAVLIVAVAGVTWYVRHRTAATPVHGAGTTQPVGMMQPVVR